MCPEFELFGLSMPTYGALSFAGFWLCIVLSFALIRHRRINGAHFLYTTIVAMAGLFLCSHLLYGLTRIEDLVAIVKDYPNYNSFDDFVVDVSDCFMGMVFYGGLYGMLIFSVLFAKKKRYHVREITDVYAVVIPLFHAFGRVGCFFAGCCYGVRWQYGISGRVIVADVKEHARRLPVQLIEASLLLILFAVILLLFSKNKLRHNLLFVYLYVYAVLRFVLEFFRGDKIRGIFLALSTSQWISIITIVWVSVYLILRYKKNKSKT